MKITVRKNQQKTEELFIKDVPVGYVFEFNNGEKNPAKGLKLCDNETVLLTYNNGSSWLVVANKKLSIDEPVKILGKLTEIIVEEN